MPCEIHARKLQNLLHDRVGEQIFAQASCIYLPAAHMDLSIGSPAWYLLILMAGLATGLLIGWLRKRRP